MACFSLIPIISAFLRRAFPAAGLHHKTLSIDSDTTISYWISKSFDSNPNPPLVLIHGFGPSATLQWRHQVGPLSKHFALIVPELIFFGGSTTRSDRRSELFQAESIVRLLDAVGVKEKFYVAGTSYGGFVAYHVVRMCGDRVLRAVIASSDVLKHDEDDRLLKERAGVENALDLMIPRSTEMLRKLIGLGVYKQPKCLPEFLLRDAVRTLYSENFKERLELITGMILGKDEFQVTPLHQDVLIIWGEQDRIFPLHKAFKLKETLGDKARLEIVKNTGHVPNSEDPRRFNELFLDFFLNGLDPAL